VKFLICMTLAAVTLSAAPDSQKRSKGEPEFFSLTVDAKGATGSSAASMKLQLDRYVADKDRDAVTEALKSGGSAAFLEALRKAPPIGKLTAGEKTFAVRWATETPTRNGRTIVVVVDSPVFFLGGGEVDAKPREGFDVGVIRFDFDNSGLGSGTMAAAARVKPGGPTGVQVDDYAQQPAKVRVIKVYS
jgi:hypothetical protein